MRRMPPPNLITSEVYLACVSGTNNANLNQTYVNTREDFCTNADLYRQRAMTHSLFQFVASEWGKDDQVCIGQLTKGNLKELYNNGLVNSKEGRPYYDLLLATAHLGKCTYCQFGQAESLDHFLPKARYPSLSIVPDNLVPSCLRCNTEKGSGVVTEEGELSHPYFEDIRIVTKVWLHAEITQTSPVTSKFAAVCPLDWPDELSRRVSNYFRDLKLSKRYSIEAASELVSISAYLADLSSSALRMDHLNRVAIQERQLSPNGWKAALYNALAASNWYGEIGFAGK
jgi:5-methylcytosine-specific restriction endonuclease McrA